MKKIIALALTMIMVISLSSCTPSTEKSEEVVEPAEIPLHQLYLDIDFEANLIFSTYDVDLYLDEEKVDTLPHGKHYTRLVEVEEGTHSVTFYKQDEDSVSASEKIDVISDMTFQCHIQTHSSSIDVDKITVLDSIEGSSIVMPDVTGTVLSDACNLLAENGFINIDYQADDDSSIWDEDNWTVIAQNIESGKEIDKNEAILLTCLKTDSLNTQSKEEDSNSQDNVQETISNEETDKPESSVSIEEDSDTDSVDYSTNNESTVKNGDSGVYSYKSRGGTYDNYYLIDFDEGYVYFFSDGNGDEEAMRTNIESGNLNDVVIITYHAGEDEWSEGLHFKWKNRPDHLIMQDHNGFEYDFYTTNLNNARKILQTKNVSDY